MLDEMLTRINHLEKNINDLMELKQHNTRTSQSIHKFQQPNWPSRRKDIRDWRSTQWNKTRGKIREKRVKRNEQSLQKIWDYVKRPNLHSISAPECNGENESKMENTLQDIGQANIQVQEIQRKPQRYSSRRATPRHIIVWFTRVEIKKKKR